MYLLWGTVGMSFPKYIWVRSCPGEQQGNVFKVSFFFPPSENPGLQPEWLFHAK